MIARTDSRRVLEPGERFGEIVFGLIMVLTFTCSLSVAEADQAEVRDMIIGALGCNLAWGIIDAAFYLIGCIAERGRSHRLIRLVQLAASPEAARRVVADTLPDVAAQVYEERDLERLRGLIAALPEPPERPGMERTDLAGALGVFLLVFLSTFPVVLPFFFVEELGQALRISNGIALVLLFGVGFQLARHAGMRPVRTATALAGIGFALVAVAIALGG